MPNSHARSRRLDHMYRNRAGPWGNTGTWRSLSPPTPFGVQVSDVDPSHYFGVEGGITLTKYTNGVDANEAPGVLIPVGDPVEWTYDITNTGNTALSSIAFSDDQLGAVTCPEATLPVGGTMTCTAAGTATGAIRQHGHGDRDRRRAAAGH